MALPPVPPGYTNWNDYIETEAPALAAAEGITLQQAKASLKLKMVAMPIRSQVGEPYYREFHYFSRWADRTTLPDPGRPWKLEADAPSVENLVVTGSASVGQTLTASYIFVSPNPEPEEGSTFQWYLADDASGANATPIAGATSKTYTVVEADADLFIRFGVIPCDVNVCGFEQFTAWTEVTVAAPSASDVTITGATVGQTATGSYTYSGVLPESASTFQWYLADDATGTNKTAISGATTKTLSVTTAYVDKFLMFEVTPCHALRCGTAVSSSYTTVAVPAPSASAVTITGATVGQTATGNYTYSGVLPDSASTFQWYRADSSTGTGATAISGATSKTYAVVAADAGKFLQFRVTPCHAKGCGTVASSSYATVVTPAPSASAVTITGATVGQTATGNYTYSGVLAESGSTFQWYRADDAAGTNAMAISGATAKTYAVVAADVDKFLQFRVTPCHAQGCGTTVSSSYTTVAVPAPSASNVQITGDPILGETLTGSYDYSGVLPESGSTFQWYHADDAIGTNAAPISGATATTYVITEADGGKYVRFGVTPSDGMQTGAEAFSEWTAAYTPNPLWPYTSLLLHFEGTDGQTTTVDSGPLGKTVQLINTAALSAAAARFGTTGLGTSQSGTQRAVVADGSGLIPASADWGIAGWFKKDAETGAQSIFEMRSLASQRTPYLYIHTNRLQFFLEGSVKIANTAVPTGDNFVSVSKSGNFVYLHLNGIYQGSYDAGPADWVSPQFILGGGVSPDAWPGPLGIDEWRVLNGIAPHANTSNYTPPTEPYKGPYL